MMYANTTQVTSNTLNISIVPGLRGHSIEYVFLRIADIISGIPRHTKVKRLINCTVGSRREKTGACFLSL